MCFLLIFDSIIKKLILMEILALEYWTFCVCKVHQIYHNLSLIIYFLEYENTMLWL